jgi:pimeloyl-ACP methyl ester carboxylesterase
MGRYNQAECDGYFVTSNLPEPVICRRDWQWRGWTIRYAYARPRGIEPTESPLILVHGFGASLEHWQHNLTELAQNRSVYALDLLGFGASDKVFAPYSPSGLWAEQVCDFWSSLVQRPAIIVGNSIGSLVAIAAAAAQPELCLGLVLINLPDASVVPTQIPKALQGAIARVSRLMRPFTQGLVGVLTSPPLFSPFFYVLRQPRLIRSWLANAYVNPALITPERVAQFCDPAFDLGAGRALRAMVTHAIAAAGSDVSATAALSRLQVPILLLWGKQDKLVPPQLGPLFKPYNPRLELIELDQAGHCPQDECPEVVNGLILEWLATQLGETVNRIPVGKTTSYKA